MYQTPEDGGRPSGRTKHMMRCTLDGEKSEIKTDVLPMARAIHGLTATQPESLIRSLGTAHPTGEEASETEVGMVTEVYWQCNTAL
jgi:hypothetical protein